MDELDPQPIAPKPDLERLSVDELEARISELQSEIDDCRAELERKQAHKSAADALFGKGN